MSAWRSTGSGILKAVCTEYCVLRILHCNIYYLFLLAEVVTKIQSKSPLYFIPPYSFEKGDVSLFNFWTLPFIASSDTELIRTPLAMHGCTNAMDDNSFNNPSLKLFANQTRSYKYHTVRRYIIFSCFNSG